MSLVHHMVAICLGVDPISSGKELAKNYASAIAVIDRVWV
jgi:hypothetical protein